MSGLRLLFLGVVQRDRKRVVHQNRHGFCGIQAAAAADADDHVYAGIFRLLPGGIDQIYRRVRLDAVKEFHGDAACFQNFDDSVCDTAGLDARVEDAECFPTAQFFYFVSQLADSARSEEERGELLYVHIIIVS